MLESQRLYFKYSSKVFLIVDLQKTFLDFGFLF